MTLDDDEISKYTSSWLQFLCGFLFKHFYSNNSYCPMLTILLVYA